MSAEVVLEVSGRIGRLTLSNPGKFNAMSRAMWRSLQAAFQALQSDTRVRCVVVQGADHQFCAGGDIAEYPGFRFDAAQLQEFHEVDVWGGLQAMLDCDVPLIAHIEGNCMGAGLEIASCCDLRLASTSARFGAPIARLGFPMAPREAELVGRAAGATTAQAMLLAAEVFDAAHMYAQGFLTHPPSEGLLADQVQSLAERMVRLAPQAARMNKQTLRGLRHTPHQTDPTQAATRSVAPVAPAYRYADSREHREGIAAFLEKRPPLF